MWVLTEIYPKFSRETEGEISPTSEARRRVTEESRQKEMLKLGGTSVDKQEKVLLAEKQTRPRGMAEQGAVRMPMTVGGRHPENRFGAMTYHVDCHRAPKLQPDSLSVHLVPINYNLCTKHSKSLSLSFSINEMGRI